MSNSTKIMIYNACTIFLFLIIVQSCANLSSNPDQTDNNTNSKVKIYSPANDSQITEGINEIIYSIENPYSLRFVELYIDGIFQRNYPPNLDGTAPQVFFNFDSSYVGKNISLYLIYYDKDNTSQKSNTINNINITIDNNLPYKPYYISLLNFNDGSCNISWKDSSKYVEKYQIWKKIGFDGIYNLLQEVSGNSNNINDYNLDSSNIYFYKVRGIKGSGESPFSAEVNNKGIITSGDLYPPSNLTATLTPSLSVLLNWKDNSDNENYFDIQSLSQNTTSYEDISNELIIGNTFYYRIKAYSNTDSAFSNIISIKILSTILSPPTNLTATYSINPGVIELRWNKTDINTLYFDIERKIDGDTYQLLRRVDATTTLFLDFSILVNQNYFYRVRGYDLNRYSEYSNEVTVSTF
jgi:hypothetical protein